jgi:hypothetical protein
MLRGKLEGNLVGEKTSKHPIDIELSLARIELGINPLRGSQIQIKASRRPGDILPNGT